MSKLLGIVLAIVLGVFAALWLGGAGMVGYSGFGMGSGMMTGITATIAPIYLVLIASAAIVLAFLVLRWPRHATATNRLKSTDSALDISRARYAKGEITKEQFDRIKSDLRV